MSDGQTFLLLLGVFYALECFCMAPTGSAVYVRTFGRHHGRRSCLLEFGGIRKELYFLYFLPWPGRAHVVGGVGGRMVPEARRLSSARRYLRVLNRAGEPLVMNGVLLALIFFMVLPVTYWRDPMSERVMLMAGAGYVLLFWQTGCYWCVHRRFFPERGEERLKCVLTMAVLPWHGMKAVDHLVLHPKLRLGTFEAQALLLFPKVFGEVAKKEWRRACHGPGADQAGREALERFLDRVGVDRGGWERGPEELAEGDKYCPVCHGIYHAGATRCSDCGGVVLVEGVLRGLSTVEEETAQ